MSLRSARVRAIFLACAMAVVPAAASAHGYKLGAIEIGHVWAPPSRDGATAVYGPLFNTGGAPDALLEVSSPIATSVAVKGKDGMPIATLALPPGKPVSLASWGPRIAISGLTHPVARGGTFDLVLRFAKAGTITVKVLVQPTAAEP